MTPDPIRLHHEDYVTIRDLFQEIQEEGLSAPETRTLGKVIFIMAAMEAKRAAEDRGEVPRTRKIWRRGRLVKIDVRTGEEVR